MEDIETAYDAEFYIHQSQQVLKDEGGVKEGSWLPVKSGISEGVRRSSEILEFATEESELNAELIGAAAGVDKSSCSFHYTEEEMDLERMSDAENDIDVTSPQCFEDGARADVLGIKRIIELADVSRRLVPLDMPLCQYLINSMKQMSNSLVTIQVAH